MKAYRVRTLVTNKATGDLVRSDVKLFENSNNARDTFDEMVKSIDKSMNDIKARGIILTPAVYTIILDHDDSLMGDWEEKDRYTVDTEGGIK